MGYCGAILALLGAFLTLVGEQVAVLEESLEQLYDDLFLETNPAPARTWPQSGPCRKRWTRSAGAATAATPTAASQSDYGTLEEALRDLGKRRDGRACVCLLPGEHEWAGDDVDYLHHLDVHGCGAVLVLVRFTGCGATRVRACQMVAAGLRRDGHRTGRRRAALAFEEPLGPIWVCGNDLIGGVSLYGVASPERIGELEENLDVLIERASDPPKVEVGPARLDLHENRLAWVLLGVRRGQQPQEIVAVETARVGDNVVDGGPLEVRAGRVTFHDNDLNSSGTLVAVVYANVSSVVGNVTGSPGTHVVLSAGSRAEAANVDMSVVP